MKKAGIFLFGEKVVKRMRTISLFLVWMLMGAMTMARGQERGVPLTLAAANMHDMTLRQLPGGELEVQTTGSDPYVFTDPLPAAFDARKTSVLAFEFFSASGTDHFQVFVLPPLSEDRSLKVAGLAHSEGWSAYALDLHPIFAKAGAAQARTLRLDFGGQAGKTIRLRGLQMRGPTPQEIALAERKAALLQTEQQHDERLRTYLHHIYPSRITNVAVGERQIVVSGMVTGERSGAVLVEVPLYADVTSLQPFATVVPLHPGADGKFVVTVDRYRPEGIGREGDPGVFDRLLARWAVAHQAGDTCELRSHARYPDSVKAKYDLPEEKPRNKKGIGGFGSDRPIRDVADLGLSAATVNIVLNSLFATTPGPGRTAFNHLGRIWYAEDRDIANLDRTLQRTAQSHLIVSAIILLGQGGNAPAGSYSHRVAHPDADPSGIFVMPNLISADGLAAYAAGMDYLAQRYSRPDNRYGRIHHWILHNEVNAGWVWTNAGDKTPLLYTDLYHRSLRVAHLIARQYDAHAKVFISLEHHWNVRPTHIYAGREILDDLLDLSHAEGDFDWGLAYHPYPQNLFDPRVWADNEVNFTFDTPKITFKNLEVLDAWVRQPRAQFQGKTVRTIHLSEQGLNSKDYSTTSLTEQAAGMAYAWNKYKNLSSIEVFHYHNWVDNRGEGGLRIGLRRFPDDPDEPLGKKPIWYVYQALGTAKEAEATEFAKKIIGITDWSEVRFRDKIR